MKDYLILNIKSLLGIDEGGKLKFRAGEDMDRINSIDNAFLLISNGRIKDFGKMLDIKANYFTDGCVILDATDRYVLPAWCDSHTHIVYANSREQEYVDKIKGLSYEEIARRGGGILNSVERLHHASEEQLYDEAFARLEQMRSLGTGAVEIKSGYGLTTESELKMLRVIRRLKETSDMTIRSTFLGAHSIPMEFRDHQEKYVDIIVNEMIPEIAKEKLADFVDVFCDRGFFTVEDTARILEAGAKYGMRPKIHARSEGAHV